jgi:hypothetical protein
VGRGAGQDGRARGRRACTSGQRWKRVPSKHGCFYPLNTGGKKKRGSRGVVDRVKEKKKKTARFMICMQIVFGSNKTRGYLSALLPKLLSVMQVTWILSLRFSNVSYYYF